MVKYECLDVKNINDVTVARLCDSRIIENQRIKVLGRELSRLVEIEQCKKVLLDFSTVDFLGSAALSSLLILANTAKKHECTVKFCSVRPEIQQVFMLTKLDELFGIEKDEAEGLASF